MEAAIANDDVIWHATAVNFLPEVLDEETWAYSMGMAAALNKRFNKSWGTIAGKHTDTPGMSKGAIPALLRQGVRAYHIGYNSACAKNVAELPPAFRWRAPGAVSSTSDDSSVVNAPASRPFHSLTGGSSTGRRSAMSLATRMGTTDSKISSTPGRSVSGVAPCPGSSTRSGASTRCRLPSCA